MDPILFGIILEVILVTSLLGAGFYVGTHMKKTSK